jgi:hypothetical protein
LKERKNENPDKKMKSGAASEQTNLNQFGFGVSSRYGAALAMIMMNIAVVRMKSILLNRLVILQIKLKYELHQHQP